MMTCLPPVHEIAKEERGDRDPSDFEGAVRDWSDEDVVSLASSLTRLRQDYATAMAGEPVLVEAGR